jgi:hypothetical protein
MLSILPLSLGLGFAKRLQQLDAEGVSLVSVHEPQVEVLGPVRRVHGGVPMSGTHANDDPSFHLCGPFWVGGLE